MRSLGLFSGTLLLSFLASGVAAAHLDLTDPPHRGARADQKIGPCEGKARGTTPKAYTGGAKVTIKWTETVEHENGFFRISLDPEGDKFDTDKDGVPDRPVDRKGAFGNGNDSLKLLDIPDRDISMDGKPDYSAEITMPNIDCTNCTLQVIQMMGDKDASAVDPTNHIYFRCADITIKKDVAAPAMGGAGGMAAAGGAGGVVAGGGMGGAGGMAAGGAGGMAAGGMATGGTATGTGGVPVSPVVPGPVVVPPAGGASGTTGGAAGGGAAVVAAPTTTDDEGGCAVVSTKSTGTSTAWGIALVGLALAWRMKRRA